MDKDRSLIRIIEVENPVSALIFCNTKMRVNYVSVVLQRFGYDADELTSDLSQAAREKVLERVRRGTLRFLVATDVAARGIDLPELSHVFQYEPPDDPEAYIHRAGPHRAGWRQRHRYHPGQRVRARRFAAHWQTLWYPLQELPLPSDEDVEKVVSERIITLLEARLRTRDRLQTERMQRFLSLAQHLGETEAESNLMAMLLDDFYQETFHSPVVPPESDDPSARRTASPPEKAAVIIAARAIKRDGTDNPRANQVHTKRRYRMKVSPLFYFNPGVRAPG